MDPGLNSVTFFTMFPQFATAPVYLVDMYVSLINNGYGFITNGVTDLAVLNIYYMLLAHFVASTTMPTDPSQINYAAPLYTKTAENSGQAGASYVNIPMLTADISMMNSTWYGQQFYSFARQNYIQNTYFG